MNTSEELKRKINLLFKNNEKVRDNLLAGNVETIREIGLISQKGINPKDIVAAYESDDSDSMKAIYDKAQELIELQKIYRELCLDYYNKSKDESEVR